MLKYFKHSKIIFQLDKILSSRYSYVKLMYEQSRSGSRSPQEAALRVEKTSITPSTPLNKDREFSRPTTPQTPGKTRRKISMNPMPMLNRMLSRQD